MTEPVKNKTEWDIPSITKPEGYLFVDHRNSPGLPEDVARKMGYDPALVREGKVFEAATKKCAHCPSVVIKNPLRTRERGHCLKCNAFICDSCAIAMKDPNYVHRSAQEIIDLVTSGWEMSGSMSMPTLTRKERANG